MNSAIKTKELNKLVKQEADNLKKFATKEEINKLNFLELDPGSIMECIYGQMAGYCDSERAAELMKQCCQKMIYNFGSLKLSNESKLEENSEAFNNFGRKSYYWSPIEIYIYKNLFKDKMNKNLIDYIKGTVKELKFK